jgi:GNAT superfamily N-acetyltransferase
MLHIHACTHISMLFVAPEHQGRGCGARLIRAATEAGALRPPLTVNASPNAVGFYTNLGFVPAGPEQASDGVRIQPMRHPGPLSAGAAMQPAL